VDAWIKLKFKSFFTYSNACCAAYLRYSRAMKNLTQYQQQGIEKLYAYTDCFDTSDASYKAVNLACKTEFIRIFCDHELADSDYGYITDKMRNLNREDFLQNLSMRDALKMLTYIIWTDKIMEGFFLSKVNDQTLFKLMQCLQYLAAQKVLLN
jgi:hypothetical protein